jgi:hypothetical protein
MARRIIAEAVEVEVVVAGIVVNVVVVDTVGTRK